MANKSNGKKTEKRTAVKAKKGTTGKKVTRETEYAESNFTKSMPWILIVLSVFIAFSYIMVDKMGTFGKAFNSFFRGMAGGACFAVPILGIIAGVLWRRRTKQGKLVLMVVCQAVFYLSFCVLIHLWTGKSINEETSLWEAGKNLVGGGLIGGSVGGLLLKTLGSVGTHIIFLPVLLVTGLLSVGITPYALYIRIAYRIKTAAAERKEARELEGEKAYQRELSAQKHKYAAKATEERRKDFAEPSVIRDPNDKHHFTPDVDLGDYEEPENVESKKNLEEVIGDENPEPEKEKESVFSRLADRIRRKSEGRDIFENEEDDSENDDDDGIPPFDVPGVGRLPDLPMKSDAKDPPKPQKTPTVSGNDGNLINKDELDMLNRFAKDQQRKEQEKNALMADREGAEFITEEEELEEIPVKKEYVYPPVSLLKYDLTPKNTDISEELSSNANKLVETLKSFKVETRLVDVSRGPAITRYELAPKEGVRVRQIANLVDDIALNLATTGVRIEAPIPGKAAVGVEVPNKTVSTVYLRELVDTESFRKATSKLNVCLGVDVAGDPVFLDIAKMPHLLIAGATGMGKSVCINSVITSLLYKASPDDVRLILIDPKKVELSIYNGLPHLLIPVVSDPKKAAGSLQWAVTEMERRFSMIDAVGVRDIKMYNTVTADDPDKEHMTQIVIIIDELADLMMTAPDDVENSICRLAQKARAAGMHLIIGTQRPSVDVITGLIKANVPSRIAFTVASQTDSRVVLDMSGAEKLIGRGDMLYAPVGASKPRRVQGAFVSEGEVEAIVNFIKEENDQDIEYNSDIADTIERNAASIGNKKGAAAAAISDDGEDDENDPMLRQAIELAIDSGKISTSLIQRKLSLGYGRAAKLIDKMENMGIVSAPEGQKPRNVLISRQQWMEMTVARGDDL